MLSALLCTEKYVQETKIHVFIRLIIDIFPMLKVEYSSAFIWCTQGQVGEWFVFGL